jgi:hypothetical protein
MEAPVEIRYAGVVIARANEVRRMTVGGVDMFLSMPEPLPAGTLVSLSDGSQARVEKVIESTDPSVAGIYVRLLAEGEASQPWAPSFREAEVPAPRPPAVVVSPIIVRPVHRATPHEGTSRPEPVRVEAPPPPPRPEPVIRREETPLPEVVAVVPEPVPTVEKIADPPRAFTAPIPKPDEKIAHFEAPEPPPAVVEGAIKRERSKRSTIVVAIPPPAETDGRSDGAVKRAAGEIDTGSRRVNSAQAQVQSASIVVEPEPHEEPAAAAEPEPEHDAPKQAELKLEDLSTAKPLPSARGRATKRRKTNLR